MIARKWLITGGVALVAAALVVGALATRDAEEPASSTDIGASPTSAAEATTSRPAGSSVTSVTPGGVAPESSSATTGAPDARGTTAADGARLKDILDAPAATLAVITGGSAAEGDRYAVVFRPYGWGPQRQGGRGLVVRIDSARRVPGSSSEFIFESGQNVLVTVPEVLTRQIVGGGSYSGVIALHTAQGALAPYLEEARELR